MKLRSKSPIPALTSQARLKRSLRHHLHKLGFEKNSDGGLSAPPQDKQSVRNLHVDQKRERLRTNHEFIKSSLEHLAPQFAHGSDIDPSQIRLRLERVKAGTLESELFRLASLTWAIPVSNGYGRRLRYLVRDSQNEKLVGLIALGDPVFNLNVRDSLIGWSASDRASRLVNILDAYVLGALPPYSFLLGGKAVSCLVRTKEVYNDFRAEYGRAKGLISGEEKNARLLAVTTSSALGKSSVYNRLKLGNTSYFRSIGFTAGWGHFHIPDDLFLKMREHMREIQHPYADQHRFGNGPNWRLRTIREGLKLLGMDESLLRHGVKREVFISEFAENALGYLRTGRGKIRLASLLTADEVSTLAVERWMKPRAARRPEYRSWVREALFQNSLQVQNFSSPQARIPTLISS